MDTKDVKAGLALLDPGNTDHWTAAGLPAVGAVGEILGEAVTRAQIAEAWPGFDREAANLQGEEQPPAAPEPETTIEGEAPTAVVAGDPDVIREGANIHGLGPDMDGGPNADYRPDDGFGTVDFDLGFDPGVETKPDLDTAIDSEQPDPDTTEEPDAIAMIEAALSVAQGPRYMRNHELQNFVRQWQMMQTGIRSWQKRLDDREAARVARRS